MNDSEYQAFKENLRKVFHRMQSKDKTLTNREILVLLLPSQYVQSQYLRVLCAILVSDKVDIDMKDALEKWVRSEFNVEDVSDVAESE